MIVLRKLVVFLFVSIFFIYMIWVNFKVLNKFGHNKLFTASMISGVGLISLGTFLDVIASFFHINLRNVISTCFTAGAIVFVLYLILWTNHTIRLMRALNKSAHVDSMTGVYNRKGFEKAFKEKTLKQKKFHIMIFDLDGTKRINDNFGHIQGDQYIINAAKIIKEEIGENGFVGRTGGDEFIAFVENVDKEQLENIKSFIKQRVSQINYIEKTRISIGDSIFNKDGEELEELLKIADKRMYKDKAKKLIIS